MKDTEEQGYCQKKQATRHYFVVFCTKVLIKFPWIVRWLCQYRD